LVEIRRVRVAGSGQRIVENHGRYSVRVQARLGSKELKMKTRRKNARMLDDARVNVKIKLAALWVTLLLLYIYVDIFGFYEPGVIENILAGKVWEFNITQAWALGALALMMIPILMVFLSIAVKAEVNRWLNIIAAVLYVAVGIGTMIGETWAYYIVGHVVGLVVLVIILWTALKWPRQEA
jgi:hypothetical protein